MKGGRLMFRQKDKFQKRNKRKEKRKRKILYSCALAGIAVVCIGAFSLSYGWIKNSLAGENTAQEEMKEKLKEAGIKEKLIVEAGNQMPKASEFFENGIEEASFVKTLTEKELKELGEHVVIISYHGEEYQTCLEVRDTKPPEATAKRGTLLLWADEVKPEDFIENMTDATNISVSFGKIDLNQIEKEQEVEIILEDEAKNRTQLTAWVKLKKDEEAPIISGVYDIMIYKGDIIQYRKGIEVTDNRDEEVELIIDNSQVDRDKEGEYQVIYTATDKAGNMAKESCKVVVLDDKDVPKEEVYAMADKILESILTEDMSEYDKAYAIYKWTRDNISYTGHTDPFDILAGAYRGFQYRTGDCFTYCATAYVLYQRSGFQVMKVTRDENASDLKHYWNYVKIEEGWYHCDSMLRQADFEPFMLTTEQMIKYTTEVMDRPDYYVYVEELYPPCGKPIRELNYTIPSKKSPETNLPTPTTTVEETTTIEETSTEIETTSEAPTETTSEIIWQSPPELVPTESMIEPETTQAPVESSQIIETSVLAEPDTTAAIQPIEEPETTTVIEPTTEAETTTVITPTEEGETTTVIEPVVEPESTTIIEPETE